MIFEIAATFFDDPVLFNPRVVLLNLYVIAHWLLMCHTFYYQLVNTVTFKGKKTIFTLLLFFHKTTFI